MQKSARLLLILQVCHLKITKPWNSREEAVELHSSVIYSSPSDLCSVLRLNGVDFSTRVIHMH